MTPRRVPPFVPRASSHAINGISTKIDQDDNTIPSAAPQQVHINHQSREVTLSR